ncbi:hypothetical protein P154DRAFT_526284 [Amniculicola lignicola CBS 123094]|uniref:Uncharacterized protein n=1 Tax=Amniculicola lignicola CBS 123094 TaxID=1392246 RepID=A0A6A5W5U0_9PLEO|nr:hypothetical protein P154DRAFT_526284 [Amniculicola lignicola CBS 123094]
MDYITNLHDIASRVYKAVTAMEEHRAFLVGGRSLACFPKDVKESVHIVPENKRQYFGEVYNNSMGVLRKLDRMLVRYQSLNTKSKKA